MINVGQTGCQPHQQQYVVECCEEPCNKEKMAMGILLEDHNRLHNMVQQNDQPQIRIFTQPNVQQQQPQQKATDHYFKQRIRDLENELKKERLYWKRRVDELEGIHKQMEEQLKKSAKKEDKHKEDKPDKHKDDNYKEKYEILKQKMDEMDQLWEQQIKEGVARKQQVQQTDQDNQKTIQQMTKINSDLRNQLHAEVDKNNIREQLRDKERQEMKDWYTAEIDRILKQRNTPKKDDSLLKDNQRLKQDKQLLEQSIKKLKGELQAMEKDKDQWKEEQKKLQKQIDKSKPEYRVVQQQVPVQTRVEYRVQDRIVPQVRYVKDQEREKELEQQLKCAQERYDGELKRLKQNEQDQINKIKLLELKVDQEMQQPNLNEQLNQLKLQLQSKEQQLGDMEKQKIAAQQQQYQLQKQHDLIVKQNQIKHEQLIQSIENKHHNHLESITNLHNQKVKELTLHHLEELETLKAHYQNQHQQVVNGLNVEIVRLRQQVDKLNDELSKYKDKNSELDKQKDKYKDKKKERKKIIKGLDKDQKDLNKRLKELQDENKKLNSRLQELEIQLKTKTKDSYSTIEDKDKELKKMKDQIQKMMDQKQPVQTQIKEVEKIVEREKVKEVKFIPKEFKDQQEKLVKQLGEYKAIIQQQENDHKDKKEQLKKLKKKNEKLKDLNRDQEHEINRLRRIINDLEQLKNHDHLADDVYPSLNEQRLLDQIEALKIQHQKDIQQLERENYYLRDRNLFLESKLQDPDQNKGKVIRETRVVKEKDLKRENELEIENNRLKRIIDENDRLIRMLESKVDEYYRIIMSRTNDQTDTHSLDANNSLKEKLLQLVRDNNALRKELNRINKAQYQKDELNLDDYDIVRKGNTLSKNHNWNSVREQVKQDKRALEDTLRNYRR